MNRKIIYVLCIIVPFIFYFFRNNEVTTYVLVAAGLFIGCYFTEYWSKKTSVSFNILKYLENKFREMISETEVLLLKPIMYNNYNINQYVKHYIDDFNTHYVQLLPYKNILNKKETKNLEKLFNFYSLIEVNQRKFIITKEYIDEIKNRIFTHHHLLLTHNGRYPHIISLLNNLHERQLINRPNNTDARINNMGVILDYFYNRGIFISNVNNSFDYLKETKDRLDYFLSYIIIYKEEFIIILEENYNMFYTEIGNIDGNVSRTYEYELVINDINEYEIQTDLLKKYITTFEETYKTLLNEIKILLRK